MYCHITHSRHIPHAAPFPTPIFPTGNIIISHCTMGQANEQLSPALACRQITLLTSRSPFFFSSPAGAIFISRGMKEQTNEQLADLDMGYNEIKDEGACAIAQVRAHAHMCTCTHAHLRVSLADLNVWYNEGKYERHAM